LSSEVEARHRESKPPNCRQTMDNLIDNYKDKLPESYLKFISKNKGFSGYIDNDFGYVMLWDIQEINDAWRELNIEDYLGTGWFPIGSNGGGEIIVIELASSAKELFYIPFIPLSEEHADFCCEDFSTLYDAIKRLRPE
jgi:hypothetical protein